MMDTKARLKKQIEHPKMLADTLQVDIVSAEREIFSGRAKVVIASGEEGDLGIFPGHSPLLSALKPGQIRLIAKDGSEEYYYVSGGFMEVQPYVVTILADTVLRATEIDEEQALQAKERAEKKIETKQYDDYNAALIELTKAIAQINVARKR